MVPKEHGAYGQLAPPLVTALAVHGVTLGAVLTALTCVIALFLHEPLLVLRGGRGSRAQREHAREAWRWLATGSVLIVAMALAALATTRPDVRWVLAVPLLPALVAGAAAARGQERSAVAESAAASAFAFAAWPVAAAAGASPRDGLATALPFAVVFLAVLFAVRAVTLRARGAPPRRVAVARGVSAAVAVGGMAGLVVLAATYGFPRVIAVAAAPGAALACALAFRPPSARQLPAIGWTLAATMVVTTAIFVVGATR